MDHFLDMMMAFSIHLVKTLPHDIIVTSKNGFPCLLGENCSWEFHRRKVKLNITLYVIYLFICLMSCTKVLLTCGSLYWRHMEMQLVNVDIIFFFLYLLPFLTRTRNSWRRWWMCWLILRTSSTTQLKNQEKCSPNLSSASCVPKSWDSFALRMDWLLHSLWIFNLKLRFYADRWIFKNILSFSGAIRAVCLILRRKSEQAMQVDLVKWSFKREKWWIIVIHDVRPTLASSTMDLYILSLKQKNLFFSVFAITCTCNHFMRWFRLKCRQLRIQARVINTAEYRIFQLYPIFAF